MNQFNIRTLLYKNPIIPVATIQSVKEIDRLVKKLLEQNISCVEVTLRTTCAMEALRILKQQYAQVLDIGVGTLTSSAQLTEVKEIGVDFIVSPGLPSYLDPELQSAGIAFIPGVATPTEVMTGMHLGYDTFKLFPAEIVGGTKLLKTFAGLFPTVKFCPTGGINSINHQDYLNLPNVISVGGSWIV